MAYSSVSDDLQEEFNPKKDEKEGIIREVGDQAVWSLSSCKAGTVIIQALTNSMQSGYFIYCYCLSQDLALTSFEMIQPIHTGSLMGSFHT